jgi:hypothetical protein
MGGNDSGRPHNPEAKPTVEACSRWALDVRVIGPHLSQLGTVFRYGWNRAGEPTGNEVLCAVYPDCLQLAYKTWQSKGEWERVKETVRLDTTHCHYGGQRYWFRCPRCDRRTAVIYIVDRPFRCRVCLRLGYHSQRQTVVDRRLDHWQTLLCRLGGSGSTLEEPRPRPKGMQRRVYRRLRREIERARFRFWTSVAKYHKSFPSDPEDDDEDWDDNDWDDDDWLEEGWDNGDGLEESGEEAEEGAEEN